MSDLPKTQSTPNHQATAWEDVVRPRRAGPPLRFKGHRLCHHTLGDAQQPFVIELWRRKTPGYVAALAGPDGADAVSDKQLGSVMTWLEQLCSESPVAPDATVEVFLQRTPRAVRAHQMLRRLAGVALASWDELDQTTLTKDRR